MSDEVVCETVGLGDGCADATGDGVPASGVEDASVEATGVGLDVDASATGDDEASGDEDGSADAVGVGDEVASCADAGRATNVPNKPIKSIEAIKVFGLRRALRPSEASLKNMRIGGSPC